MLQLGGGKATRWVLRGTAAAGKLYLDLNRNLDLTDDPAGVFSCERGFSGQLPDLHQHSLAFQDAGWQPPNAGGPQFLRLRAAELHRGDAVFLAGQGDFAGRGMAGGPAGEPARSASVVGERQPVAAALGRAKQAVQPLQRLAGGGSVFAEAVCGEPAPTSCAAPTKSRATSSKCGCSSRSSSRSWES